MSPSRRQFVAGTLTSVPALMLVPPTFAQRTRPALPPSDPVLTQIQRELARVYDEVKGQKVIRVDTLRAFESALRMHAAHIVATGTDALVKRRLAGRIDRAGRAAVVDEITKAAHEHRRHDEIRRYFPRFAPEAHGGRDPLSAEQAESGINAVLASGVSPAIVTLAAGMQSAWERLAAAGPASANVRRVQFDQCWALQQAINIMEQAATVVCVASIFDPALVPLCAAMSLEVVLARVAYHFACELSI